MSLQIKRQNIHKAMRKQQINSKLKRIRQTLKFNDEEFQTQWMHQKQLRQMNQAMENNQYSPQACLQFMRKVNRFCSQSLATPFLFVYISRILTNLENQKSALDEEINNLIKSTCLRVIEKRDSQNGTHNWLQRCYNQILQIACHPSTKMKQLWPALGLVRSEVFYRRSLFDYLSYIANCPEIAQNQFKLIFQTFTNFTTVIQGQKKNLLKVNQIFHIFDKINLVCINYDLCQDIIDSIAKILNNVLSNKEYFQSIIELLTSKDMRIIDCLLTHLANWDQKDEQTYVIRNILQLIAVFFSESSQCAQKIVNSNPKVIDIIVSLLPVNLPFGHILNPKIQFRHNFLYIIIAVLFCLCNMVTCQKIKFVLNKLKVIDLVMAFGSYSISSVRSEVSIFLYNYTLSSEPQQIEICCERGIVDCLCNIINSEDSSQAIRMSLNTLQRVLTASSQFPPNNIAWSYTKQRIAELCKKHGILNRLQHFLFISNQNIVSLAFNCLSLINQKYGQQQL